MEKLAPRPRHATQKRRLLAATLWLTPLLLLVFFAPHILHRLYGPTVHPLGQYIHTVEKAWAAEDPVGDRIGQPSLHPLHSLRKTGENAMVSCDVPLCSTMGKQILQRGGNAADAAVTVALCIGSVNSHSSGIGGGGFIVSQQGNSSISIDAREMAPAAAHKHMYDGIPLLAQFGGLAVAVPGELAGLHELHTRHGSGNLTWAQLIEPVVHLNRKGWKAPEIWTRAVHKMHELVLSRVPPLKEAWDFIFKGNQLVNEGDWIARPNYTDTLERIAQNGSAAIFYDPAGPIVPKLVAAAGKIGGVIAPQDFAHYEAKVSPVLNFTFSVDGHEYELATSASISSGLALIAGLNFYTALAEKDPVDDALLETHRLIEAMKWTASARSHLGDVNLTFWEELKTRYTSREWAQSLLEGKYADNTTFPWKHYEPMYELRGTHGTLHFSIVDAHGGALSMTTTVNLLFGSMVYDNETGIVLNDEMDDFSMPENSNAFNLTPSALNFIRPYNRPLSLMAPTIIRKDGELDLLIGAAGGLRIVTAVLQAVVRNIFHQLPLLETIAYPRLHHQLIPEFAMVENISLFNAEHDKQVPCMLCSLEEQKNHDVLETGALTAMNGIKRSASGEWEGVSDYWRKRGLADGY